MAQPVRVFACKSRRTRVQVSPCLLQIPRGTQLVTSGPCTGNALSGNVLTISTSKENEFQLAALTDTLSDTVEMLISQSLPFYSVCKLKYLSHDIKMYYLQLLLAH